MGKTVQHLQSSKSGLSPKPNFSTLNPLPLHSESGKSQFRKSRSTNFLSMLNTTIVCHQINQLFTYEQKSDYFVTSAVLLFCYYHQNCGRGHEPLVYTLDFQDQIGPQRIIISVISPTIMDLQKIFPLFSCYLSVWLKI